MRGADEQPGAMFSNISLEERVRRTTRCERSAASRNGRWSAGANLAYLDNLRAIVVPEPSSLVLLSIGLGSLTASGFCRRGKGLSREIGNTSSGWFDGRPVYAAWCALSDGLLSLLSPSDERSQPGQRRRHANLHRGRRRHRPNGARAKASGITLTTEPHDAEWGSRAFKVTEPSGFALTIASAGTRE
jgi:hypothetical protein